MTPVHAQWNMYAYTVRECVLVQACDMSTEGRYVNYLEGLYVRMYISHTLWYMHGVRGVGPCRHAPASLAPALHVCNTQRTSSGNRSKISPRSRGL